MNSYVNKVLEELKAKNPNQPEFHQAATEVLESLSVVFDKHHEYEARGLLDMLATAFGSLAMMTSVLVSPTGKYEFEAAHGTVTRHYYRHLQGEATGTNPVATIFAWSGALRKRGELDGSTALVKYADALEDATLETIEAGYMTGDLKAIFKKEGVTPVSLTTMEFLHKIAELLAKRL